ncbi:MAG: hypothetical protein ACOC4Z_01260 [Patescibacteria group bacterium]
MSVLSVILDFVDSGIFFELGSSRPAYHKWDKLVDFFWYCCVFIYISSVPISNLLFTIFTVLFLIRSLSLILFYITKDRKVFIYLPNAFEAFFWFYLYATTANRQLLQPPKLFYALSIVVFLKLIHEYLLHGKKYFYNVRLIPLIKNYLLKPPQGS